MEQNKEISILYFNTRDELIRVDLRKVLYFKSDRNYTDVFFLNGHHVTLLTSMLNIEQMLNDERMRGKVIPFIRLGRSLMVNASFIFQINVLKQELYLSDMKTSDVYKVSVPKDVLKRLKELYSNKRQ